MKTIMAWIFGLMFFLAGPVSAQVMTGASAPDFSLTDTKGVTHQLSSFAGKVVLLEWSNPDCPFVKKFYDAKAMQAWQAEYSSKGVVWIMINSSAAGKQGHFSPEELDARLATEGFAGTAVLRDPDGKVGRLYGAQTTPHIYVIDAKGKLVYQGAIDDKPTASSADIPLARNYAVMALDEVLAGKEVSFPSTKSYGCTVKY